MIVDKNAKGPFRVEKKGMMFAICDTYGVNCVEVAKYRPMLFDTEEQATDVGQYLGLIPTKTYSVSYSNMNWSIPRPVGQPITPPQPQTVTGRIASGNLHGAAGSNTAGPVGPVHDPAMQQKAQSVPSRRYTATIYDDVNDEYILSDGTRIKGNSHYQKPDQSMQPGKQYAVTDNGLVPVDTKVDVVMVGDAHLSSFDWGSIFDDDEEFF